MEGLGGASRLTTTSSAEAESMGISVHQKTKAQTDKIRRVRREATPRTGSSRTRLGLIVQCP